MEGAHGNTIGRRDRVCLGATEHVGLAFNPSPHPVIVGNVHEAKTPLSMLVEQAAKGEGVVMPKSGKLLATDVGLGTT
jgi:hypothetical protein